MNSALSIWTVYDHPSDYPHSYVARRFAVTAAGERATADIVHGADLEALRNSMQRRGLICLPRCHSDDAVIIETWL